MKKINLFMWLMFIKIISFADSLPTVGAGDDPLTATNITFGSTIETLIRDTFLDKVSNVLSSSMNTSLPSLALGVFTAIFLIDYMYCISNAYLKGDYNSLVPTTIIKSFFFICVTTAFKSYNGMPYFFAIIKEIVSYGVKLPNSNINWTWFSPTTSSSAISIVNNNGVLTQVDTVVSSVLTKLSNAPDFWTSGTFLVYFASLGLMFFLYLIVLKLFVGLILKTFEWAIGLPIALFMLAGKGHPKGEEYFNAGIQYIFYVALDFAVLMGMFAFGKDVFDTILKGMNGGIVETIMSFWKLIFATMFWKLTVVQTESIVAGIAGGAPQFSNRMGSALFSMAKMVSNATMLPGMTKTFSNAVNNKNNGGSFFVGLKEGFKDNFIGRTKTDENTGMKYFESGGLLKQIKDVNTTNILKGDTYDKVDVKGIDPITGKETTTKQYKSIKADNTLASHTKKIYNHRYDKANQKVKNKNFEKEHGMSQKDLIKKGLVTEESRNLYMKNKNEFDNIEKELGKYGVNLAKLHKKTGVEQVVNMKFAKEELKKIKETAETQFDSVEQRAFSKGSEMTKNYTQNLNKLQNSPEAQIGLIKDWLNNSNKNIVEFSNNDFKNATQNLGQNIVNLKDQKLLKKYQNSMDRQITDLIKKADNNELFDHITDDVLREKANKSYKVRIAQVQRQINNLKIV